METVSCNAVLNLRLFHFLFYATLNNVDIVWRTVSYNAFLNLWLVHFLFYVTLNIVDICKFTHKIISVTFFWGTTVAIFLIFGTEH